MTEQEIAIVSETHDAIEMREMLARAMPGAGAGVRLELRERPAGQRGVDSTVLVALITGGASVVSAFIAAILGAGRKASAKPAPNPPIVIVIKGASGASVEIASDVTAEHEAELLRKTQDLDIQRIEIRSGG